MRGLNSNDQFTINFVPNQNGTGVRQIYEGQQPACGGYTHGVGGSNTHLPSINMEKQTYRKNDVRLDDCANRERFMTLN